MRLAIWSILFSFAFVPDVFAKIDPQVQQLERELNSVKSNSEKVALHIKIAKRYLALKNPKCDTYCKSAIKLAEKHKLEILKADALGVQGEYYYVTKKYSKAATSFLAEYNLRKKHKQPKNTANAAYNLGMCYSKMSYPAGGYKKSKKYLEEALALAKKTGEKQFQEQISEQLYLIAYDSGKYKDATEYIKNNLQNENAELRHDIKELQDTVMERDSTIIRQDSVITKVREENAILDTTVQVKNRELDSLSKEQIMVLLEVEQKRNQVTARNYTIIVIALVSLMLIVIILLLLRRNSERKKMNKALSERNNRIAEQNAEILSNLKIINQKNRDITDSLNYAGKIQKSLLRNFANYSHLISGYFILYLPKDIVSGDFYWGHQVDDKFVFTVGDCTGHSVPGAFMSMLGISLLNQIVGQQHIIKASEILEKMRESVKLNLGQSGDDEEAKDGMDMALCVWDYKKGTINYSGAYNPMFMVRSGELTVFNPEKCPVGIHAKEVPFTYQYIDVVKGDRIFMFSDGYADQFGGPRFEKFKLARFKKLLIETSYMPMHMQYDKLESTFVDWKQDMVQIDDVCVLGVEI